MSQVGGAGGGGVARQVPPGLDYLDRRIRQLEAQLRLMGAAQRIGGTNFVGGHFRWQDDNRISRLELGNQSLIGTALNEPTVDVYAMTARGDERGIAFMTVEGERGLVAPAFPIAMHPVQSETTGSGTFTTLFETTIMYPVHEVIFLTYGFSVDAGTTAETRLLDEFTGISTSLLPLGDGSSGVITWHWLHPARVGLYDESGDTTNRIVLKLEARVTSGPGEVSVGWPNRAAMVSRFQYPQASTTGAPEIL